MNSLERFTHSAIGVYKTKVVKDGGLPTTSEFVDRCNRRYGLSGALAAYTRINEKRAEKQLTLMKKDDSEPSNFSKAIFTGIFAGVVTPTEILATLAGQGKKFMQFNQSLGAADWDLGKQDKSAQGSWFSGLDNAKDIGSAIEHNKQSGGEVWKK